jgi:hypothetical protein
MRSGSVSKTDVSADADLKTAGSQLSLGSSSFVCKHDLLRFKTCAHLSKKALREKTTQRGLRISEWTLDETKYGVSSYVATRTQDVHPGPGRGR